MPAPCERDVEAWRVVGESAAGRGGVGVGAGRGPVSKLVRGAGCRCCRWLVDGCGMGGSLPGASLLSCLSPTVGIPADPSLRGSGLGP